MVKIGHILEIIINILQIIRIAFCIEAVLGGRYLFWLQHGALENSLSVEDPEIPGLSSLAHHW